MLTMVRESRNFVPNDKGLYTIRMDGRHNVGQMFFNTVHENYEVYTKQQIYKAMKARKHQMMN